MKPAYGLIGEIAERYKISIDAFDKEFGGLPTSDRVEILYMILHHCEAARTFDWTADNENRRDDSAALTDRKAAAASARKLERFCRIYPDQAMVAVMAAQWESGVYLRVGDEARRLAKHIADLGGEAREGDDLVGFGAGQSIRLAKLLTALADQLDAGYLLAKAGPMLHRFRHGPLLFAKPIDRRAKLPEPPTCLAIFLSFLLRRHDAIGQMGYSAGEPISTEGRPRWPLVSQFVNDALGVSSGQDHRRSASSEISRNPDLQICGYHRD